MTKEESREATPPYDRNEAASSSMPNLKGAYETMGPTRENKSHSASPLELGLSKSPICSSSGFPSRSGSNIGSEASETELYIRSILNKTNDLGSEDSFVSYRSDEELPTVLKRRSESFDDGPRMKYPQTKKHASDLIGLASKNFPYHLTERQKAMISPRYKTERYLDSSRSATFKEKLAAMDYHSIDLPDVTPEQIRAAYFQWSREESDPSVSSSSQPLTETARPILTSKVDAFIEHHHRELYGFSDEERIGVYPSSVGDEEDYDDWTLGSEEDPEEIKRNRDGESVNDESEVTKVEEQCPTARLSARDSDVSKSTNSPAEQ